MNMPAAASAIGASLASSMLPGNESHAPPVAAPVRRPVHQERAIEYLCASIMIGWALVMALPGDTLAASSLAPLKAFGIEEAWIAAIYGIGGSLRMVALIINGRWPRGPVFRVIGAGLGLFLWAQVSLVIVFNSLAREVATTGLAIYPALALAELYSIFRAAGDGRYTRAR